MANLVSPGITIRERDLSTSPNTVSANNVAVIVGAFTTGVVDTVTFISSEADFVKKFGKPTENNYEDWFVASSFLAYGGTLGVVRPSSGVGTSTANVNAVTQSITYSTGSTTIAATPVLIANDTIYDNNYRLANNAWDFAAKYAGDLGNSIGISVIDAGADSILTIGSGFTGTFTAGQAVTGSVSGATGVVYSYAPATKKVSIFKTGVANFVVSDGIGSGTGNSVLTITDWYSDSENYAIPPYTQISNGTIAGLSWGKIAKKPATTINVAGKGGAKDEINILVYDVDGKITGTPGTILEKYLGLSKASDARSTEGANSFYGDVIRAKSEYIYWGGNSERAYSYTNYALTNTSNLGGNSTTLFDTIGNVQYRLSGGFDNLTPTTAETNAGYNLFLSIEELDVDYLLAGKSYTLKSDYISKVNTLISIANQRKDCIAFISPWKGDVVGVSSSTTQTTNIVNFFSGLTSTSYAVFDSGIKYTYDRYNDKYRYIGCAGDVAGLIANNAINGEAWVSPAGITRGQIKNAVRLAYNPTKDQRDSLYVERVNPITSLSGQGIVLFGDKTALAQQSAFDRINVRKLFLSVERFVQSAANRQLFEFNDTFTRASFKAIVEPYLQNIQSRRGIQEYLVICDETNNTATVIDNNEFVADIYIKPSKSINFITLTFVATRQGISIAELVNVQ